jgi:hypothetical protein
MIEEAPVANALAASLVHSFESYRPSVNGNQLFPPNVFLRYWGQPQSANSIHYGRQETLTLITEIIQMRIPRKQVVISSFGNGLPSILWGQLFETVTTIRREKSSTTFATVGKYTTAFGDVANTRFMYELIKHIGLYSTIILDDLYYAALISPYYLLRRALCIKPGLVIFVNTRRGFNGSIAGVQRFLDDLKSGTLDGIAHDIRESTGADGVGFSYEVVA